MSSPDRTRFVTAYVLMGFSIGFAWFVLAPMVPGLIGLYKSSLAQVLLLISLYGYAMVVVSFPAAWWAMKSGPQKLFKAAVIISVIGLAIRAIGSSYSVALIGQGIAALAYPMIISPIGAVLKLTDYPKPRSLTGLTIGLLFFGMALGAFIAPSLLHGFGIAGTMWFVTIINALAGINLLTNLKRLPLPQSAPAVERPLLITRWSLVGLAVASISVMLGSIAGEALGKLGVSASGALALGSLLTALTFLGSAVGAVVLARIADGVARPEQYQKVLAVLTWLALLWVGLALTGHAAHSAGMLEVGFFVFGAFGNGWYSLALEASARKAQSAGAAGISTAGFSIVSNLGVAILPVFLGPLILTSGSTWLVLTLVLMLIAVLVPLLSRQSHNDTPSSRTA